jgi:L-lactate dehydrogenase complex protein LldG
MTPREAILGRIRRELGRAAGEQVAPLAAPALRIPLLDRNLYKDLFVQNFEKLAGTALVVQNTWDVVPALAPMLQGKSVVTSNAPFLRTCGIAETGCLREACATADIGITSVDYALAATGTMVMLASPSEARLISLLPPIHIAIIPRSKIIANLDELLSILPQPAEHTSSMVLITGPSRTADIEQILVRGVHGPGEIHAVIVEEA